MLFTDTSALFAFLVEDDQHHLRALAAHATIRERREATWTIDPVITELWSLLDREQGSAAADRLVRALLGSGVRREPVELDDYARAWQIARDWPDQHFSLTDRQAFAAMERSRRTRAWSYDPDFQVIRLGPNRDRPIELI